MQETTNNLHLPFPQEIKEWLNARALSDSTIEKFGLYWNSHEIVIPVFDIDGKLIFNKYRRDPRIKEPSGIPKYRYDKGSEVALFNIQTLKGANPEEPIFIVEGEFDAMVLEDKGYKAVTSTGGAMSFQEEWVGLLGNLNKVIICFDNDEAGIRGMIRLKQMIPAANLLFITDAITKDVTDFITAWGIQDFIDLPVYNGSVPSDIEGEVKPSAVIKKVKEFGRACDEIREEDRKLTALGKYNKHLVLLEVHLKNRYEFYNKYSKELEARPKVQNDKVAQAKTRSIRSLISFNHAGYAPCIWHGEKTASMFYNKETSKFPNTVKCFGCGAFGDAIDVVMKLQNVDFNTAVKFLNNE